MSAPHPAQTCEFTLGEIGKACDGTVRHADPGSRVRGVFTDSRSVLPGALFIALKGERFDGHLYAADSVRAGAAAVLVHTGFSTPSGETVARVEVADTTIALGSLARFHSARLRADALKTVVAIGGSAGKTTTKELTAAVLRSLHTDVHATEANHNNFVGVSSTLLRLDARHRAAVIECGTNHPGEVAALGAIVEPDVAVVLNVDVEHTEFLGTLDDIADEECALFLHAQRSIVANAADVRVASRAHRAGVPVTTFSSLDGPSANIKPAGMHTTARGTTYSFTLDPTIAALPTWKVETRLFGAVVAENIGAALACARASIEHPLAAEDLDRIAVALAAVTPAPRRFVLHEVGGRCVIDDSYNANPRSMRAGIRTAKEIASIRGVDLTLVLGDMRELGSASDHSHDEVLSEANAVGANRIVLVGPEMASASARTRVHPSPERVSSEADVDLGGARPEVVLVKASRGTRLDILVDRLVGASQASSFH